MTLRNQNIIISFIIAAALLFFIAAISFKHITSIHKNRQEEITSHRMVLELNELYSNLQTVESSNRAFVITKDSIFITFRDEAIAKIGKRLKKVDSLSQDNIAFQSEFQNIKKEINDRIKNLQSLTILSHTKSVHDTVFLKPFYDGNQKMISIKQNMHDLTKKESEILAQNTKESNESLNTIPIIIYVVLLLTLALMVLAFIRIFKDLKRYETQNKQLKLSKETNGQAEKIGNFGTWEWNVSSNEFIFSENLFHIFGLQSEKAEHSVKTFLDLVHPDDKQLVIEKYKHIQQHKSLEHFQHRIITPNGIIKHISLNSKLIQDKHQNEYLVIITTDITEFVQQNEAIALQNEELQQKTNQLSLALEINKKSEMVGNYGSWKYNFNTHKFTFSDNEYRLIGCEPQSFEASLENFYQFVHPEDLEFVKVKSEEMFANAHLSAFRYRIIRKDNQEVRYLQGTGSMSTNTHGDKIILGATIDVTDEVHANKAIEERNKELEINNKELSAFNYAASHDLQEPLRKIETFLSRLIEKEYDKLSDSGKTYVDRIQNSSGRMRMLINDLLQFSRTIKDDQKFESYDFLTILDQVQQELSHRIEETNAEFTAEGNFPKNIRVVPFQIHQLLTNLIGNALKYAQNNSIPKIVLSVEKANAKNDDCLQGLEGNYYRFTLTDNGIGFEQEYAEKIFTLFTRLHNKDEYAGTGIGLAICKKIIDNHKGFIFAKSKPNQGSTFTFYIPEK